VRVLEDGVRRATEILEAAFGAVSRGRDGRSNGWLDVRVAPDRVADVNRALVTEGVSVVGLEVGSDLEELFLSLTEG
jgi:hypothetical protein